MKYTQQMDVTISSVPSRKESFLFYNTLSCLLKVIEKRYTTIDLKNETCVTGKIANVDGYMNVTVTDAALYDTDGTCRYFPNLYVQARNIRYVHIPNDIKITNAINHQMLKTKGPAKKNKLTFKQSRARKQQKETLELIKKIKEEKSESQKLEKTDS